MVIDWTKGSKQLKKLKEYAEAHPLPLSYLQDLINKKPGVEPIDNDERHVAILEPDGLRVVYSIQETSDSMVRHLNMSLRSGKLPNVAIGYLITDQLGFSDRYENFIYTMEDIGGNRHAMNIREEINGKKA